jgi:hypothetical protein
VGGLRLEYSPTSGPSEEGRNSWAAELDTFMALNDTSIDANLLTL